MRVAHIVPSIAEEASGPSYSVPSLCKALASAGANVELHVLAPAPALDANGVELHAHPWSRLLKRVGISPEMRDALRAAAARSGVMHSHGMWMMPNVYPAWAVRGTRCRLVVAPRGTLSPMALARSNVRKLAMWALCQRRAVREASLLHATSEAEYRDIRRAGITAPVAVIPNGVDIPDQPAHGSRHGGRRRLLFLGRIHPIKGIDILLRAWKNVQGSHDDWELHIVGPSAGGHVDKMRALAQEIAAERVYFDGPAYGVDKWRAYADADLYVLPTHSENFGMTVAEAFAQGVPAIVTRGAPWQGLEEHDCGWWIDTGEGPLTECLRSALELSRDELRAMGSRGREWMKRDFSWERIGGMMYKSYEWLLGGGVPPGLVRL